MSFNIKEILYPSDTDQVKWEKINYNFDQILATGGKQGPKGEKGTVGVTGTAGSKGDKGDKGNQGIKGEIGTSNIWDRFGHVSIDAHVLKPKDDSTTIEPVIVLGDMGYDDGGPAGYLNPDAQLTVETADNITYAIKLGALGRYVTPSLSYLVFAGESGTVESNPGTVWVIRPHLTGANTRILINSEVIDLQAINKLYLSSANGINLSGSGTTTVDTLLVANNNVTIDAGANLTVSTGAGFFNGTGALKINVGTTAQRPTSPVNGMIRYNSTTLKFEGYSAGNWLDFMRLSNPTKSTWVSVQADANYTGSVNDKIIINAAGAIRISVNESTYNDGSGTLTGATLFNYDQINIRDVHINSDNIDGRGLIFKAGGDYTSVPFGVRAPSNGISRTQRRLNDHLAIKYAIDNTGVAKPLKTISNGLITGSTTNITGYTTNSIFSIQYVKVGWNLSVNGYFKIDQNGSWPTTAGQQLFIDLGVDYRFPYTNWSNSNILVDVQLLTARINDAAVNFKIYGIIPPNQKRIYLWMESQVEDVGPPAYVQVVKIPLEARDLVENNSEPVEFLFNFNMPASTVSYYAFDGTVGNELPE